MKLSLQAIALISLLFIANNTNAQSTKHIYTGKGAWELGGELFFTSFDNEHSRLGNEFTSGSSNSYTNFALDADAGYFVINGLKLGADLGFEADDVWGHTQNRIKVYFTPEYVMNTKSIIYPYIAASAGYTLFSVSSSSYDGFSWGAKGGVKLNIAGNSLLNIGLTYYEEQYNSTQQTFFTPETVITKDKYKQLGVTLGWSVFF